MRVNQKLITNTNGGSEFLIVSICYDMGLLAVSELLDGPPKRPTNLLIENVESNIESGEWTLAEHQFPKVLFSSDSELEPQWIKIRNERLAVISPLLREGANKRGNSSRLTQSFHFFSLSRSFLP